jgi:hypothetical protein
MLQPKFVVDESDFPILIAPGPPTTVDPGLITYWELKSLIVYRKFWR